MCRALSFLVLAMLCVVSPIGCSSTAPEELAKARAEAEAAKDEAAKARAELEGLRTKSGSGTAKSLPVSPATPNPSGGVMTKAGLGGAGVATFADGKKRPFANMSYLEVSSGQATVVGIVGGGERELPYFKMRELLPHTDQPISKERSKERSLNLRDLSRISFGLEKLHPFVSIPGKEYEEPYCEVELEATDGKKESFPCLHRSLIFSVQYADGIGKEKLNGDLLNGMTFRADE